MTKNGTQEARPGKRVPDYGPQQSRKPRSSNNQAVNMQPIRFDPRLLLNPKAAAAKVNTGPNALSSDSSTEQTSRRDAMETESASPSSGGLGSYLERMHNVQARETITRTSKRDRELPTEDDDQESQKKMKSTFGGRGSSGIISEGLKAERQKYATEGESATIDLTNDDEEDVVFVNEVKNSADNKEVCLGRLNAQAHAFKIPSSPKYRQLKQNAGMWPPIRITFKRFAAQHNVIELCDRAPVEGSFGIKFGNLEAKMASALCPLLDGNTVNKFRVKIFIDAHAKKVGEFAGMPTSKLIPLSIILYAPRKYASAIGRHLSQKQMFLSDPPIVDSGVELDNPHKPKNFGPRTALAKTSQRTMTMTSRTLEELSRDAQNIFDSLIKSEDLLEHEVDSNIIKTELMSHQKQALQFLVAHEADSREDADFSLWKATMNTRGSKAWTNVITGHELHESPQSARGGILADVMGLGKTLSILALIAETHKVATEFGRQQPSPDIKDVERNAKTTLIICPKSVMTNWLTQIQEHIVNRKLSVYTYHGPSRTQDLDELAKHDIILASYNTVQAEWSDKKHRRNALASMNWFRIVLDEGHQIRNSSTAISRGCCALSAERRWAVTGTPIQNRLDDLGALIRFLRVKPFDEGQNWTQYITAPLRSGNEQVLPHLRLLVDSITLRRMKDRIKMTERNESIVRLDLSDSERIIYAQFAKQAGEKLRIMTGNNERLQGKSYAHVLRALGRLRMICAHGKEMLTEDDQRELEGLTLSTAIDLGDEPDDYPDDSFISEKHAYETFQLMVETETNICSGCASKIGGDSVSRGESLDPDASEAESENELEDLDVGTQDDTIGYLNPCYHLICPTCKDEYINRTTPNLTADAYHNCIYCTQYIRFGLFEISRLELKKLAEARLNKLNKGKKAKWDAYSYSGPHTKVVALLQDLAESAAETEESPDEPPVRSVVFSGWTQYLDLIEFALDKQGIGYSRLDGSMSVKARSAVLHEFSTDPNITVLLVSIKAGGQGLNLTAANHVYLMEPQFNPGVEQQAMDRVHRLGQTRNVSVKHYIMRDTVEEKILKLQEKKKDLARLTMERKMSKSEEAKKRIDELKELFK